MPEARDDAWHQMEEHPVVEVEDGYAVTHRDVVELILKDPSVFSPKRAFAVPASPAPLVPIAFAPPKQPRSRPFLQPFFSPRVINPLEPDLRKQVVALIEP